MATERERRVLLQLAQAADDPALDRWVALVKTPTMIDFLHFNPAGNLPLPTDDPQQLLQEGEPPCSRHDLWSLARPERGYVEGAITLDLALNYVALTRRGRELIARGFEEVDQPAGGSQHITISGGNVGNLAVTLQGMAAIFAAPGVPQPPPGGTEPGGLYQGRDLAGYAILGFDDPAVAALFAPFGDGSPAPSTGQPGAPFEEIYFDDFAEMAQVFAAINSAIAKARGADERGGDRQKAFERAWMEECIARASYFAAYRQERAAAPPAADAAGMRYIIWGIPREQVPRVRLLRTQELIEGPTRGSREAREVYFANIASLPRALEAVQGAARAAAGDPRELMRLLAAAALRLRMFGPDAPVS